MQFSVNECVVKMLEIIANRVELRRLLWGLLLIFMLRSMPALIDAMRGW